MILAKSIDTVFKQEGYSTTLFTDGLEASAWLLNNPSAYDLVILDVLLPGMQGFEICRLLREKSVVVPILMLTSKGESEDVVTGLDCGADDYLKKPFIFDELLARIRSLTRRQPNLVDARIQLTPDVIIDLSSRQAFKEGKEVHLTAKEFGVLIYFLHNPNRILTQQELYDHVFDFAEVQLSNTIEVHVKNLRKKLRSKSFELPIITVRNAGYRFEYDK